MEQHQLMEKEMGHKQEWTAKGLQAQVVSLRYPDASRGAIPIQLYILSVPHGRRTLLSDVQDIRRIGGCWYPKPYVWSCVLRGASVCGCSKRNFPKVLD